MEDCSIPHAIVKEMSFYRQQQGKLKTKPTRPFGKKTSRVRSASRSTSRTSKGRGPSIIAISNGGTHVPQNAIGTNSSNPRKVESTEKRAKSVVGGAFLNSNEVVMLEDKIERMLLQLDSKMAIKNKEDTPEIDGAEETLTDGPGQKTQGQETNNENRSPGYIVVDAGIEIAMSGSTLSNRLIAQQLPLQKFEQNIYSTCVSEIVQHVKLYSNDIGRLLEKVRLKQDALVQKTGDMISSCLESCKSFESNINRKKDQIYDIQREAARMESNNRAIYEEMGTKIDEAVKDRQFFNDQTAEKLAKETKKQMDKLTAELKKWKSSYKRTKKELADLKALDPDQLENEKMNQALQAHMTQLEMMMKNRGNAKSISAADRVSLEKKRSLELQKKLAESEQMQSELKKELDTARIVASQKASDFSEKTAEKEKTLKLQLSEAREKISQLEIHLKSVEISRNRLEQKSKKKIKMEEARWEVLQSKIQDQTIDVEMKINRATELSNAARAEAAASGNGVIEGLELELSELDQELRDFKEELYVSLDIDSLKYSVDDHSNLGPEEQELLSVIETHNLSIESLSRDFKKARDETANSVGIQRSRCISKANALEGLLQQEQAKVDSLEEDLDRLKRKREDLLRIAKLKLEAVLKEESFEIKSMQNSQLERRTELTDEIAAVKFQTELKADQAVEESNRILLGLKAELERLTSEERAVRVNIEHAKKALETALKRADEEIEEYYAVLNETKERKEALTKDIKEERERVEAIANKEENDLLKKELELITIEQNNAETTEILREEIKMQQNVLEKVKEVKQTEDSHTETVEAQLDVFRDSAAMLAKRLKDRMVDQGQVEFATSSFQTDVSISPTEVMYKRPVMKNKISQTKEKPVQRRKTQTPKEWAVAPPPSAPKVGQKKIAIKEVVDEEPVKETPKPSPVKEEESLEFRDLLKVMRRADINPLLELISLDSKIKVHTEPKAVHWLVRFIRECYNSAQILLQSQEELNKTETFFVSRYVHGLLVQQYGVKRIVDQKLWELAATVRTFRSSNEEVKQFSEFICGKRSSEEFWFMIQCRGLVGRLTEGNLYPQNTNVCIPQFVDASRALASLDSILSSLPQTEALIEQTGLEKNMLRMHISVLCSRGKGATKSGPGSTGVISLVALLNLLSFAIRQHESRKHIVMWAEAAFSLVDDNSDGFITYEQFVSVLCHVSPPPKGRELRKLFQRGTHASIQMIVATFKKIALSILCPAMPGQIIGSIIRSVPSIEELGKSLKNNRVKSLSKGTDSAGTILQIVASRWINVVATVNNYISLLLYSDHEADIEAANAINEHRLALENALVGNNAPEKENAIEHHYSRAVESIYCYRKILLSIEEHQINAQRQNLVFPSPQSITDDLGSLETSILNRWKSSYNPPTNKQLSTHTKSVLRNTQLAKYTAGAIY